MTPRTTKQIRAAPPMAPPTMAPMLSGAAEDATGVDGEDAEFVEEDECVDCDGAVLGGDVTASAVPAEEDDGEEVKMSEDEDVGAGVEDSVIVVREVVVGEGEGVVVATASR